MRTFLLGILAFACCFGTEDRRFFMENDFIWVKGFFSGEQVDMLKMWAADMHDEALKQLDGQEAKDLIVVPEAKNDKKVCRVEDMLTMYPDYHDFIEEKVTTYIAELLGEAVVTFKDKLNFKWPGGGAFLPHQDYPAFGFFSPKEHINAMICVDAATLENGCLHIAQNWTESFTDCEEVDQEALANGRAILPYVVGGSAHGAIQDAYVEKIEWLPLLTEPGDLVLFTSYIPHYSEPNRSQDSRRAMFLTYNKAQEGEHRVNYYQAKRRDPLNPIFHFGTPTKGTSK